MSSYHDVALCMLRLVESALEPSSVETLGSRRVFAGTAASRSLGAIGPNTEKSNGIDRGADTRVSEYHRRLLVPLIVYNL